MRRRHKGCQAGNVDERSWSVRATGCVGRASDASSFAGRTGKLALGEPVGTGSRAHRAPSRTRAAAAWGEADLSREPIQYVYFLEAGLGSDIALSGEDDKPVECGMVGREGLIGMPVVLRCDRGVHASDMQVAGHGFRIP